MLGSSLSPPRRPAFLASDVFLQRDLWADVTHRQRDPAGTCLLVGGSSERLLKGGSGGGKQQIRQVFFLLCFKDKARSLRKQISQSNLICISLLHEAATEI